MESINEIQRTQDEISLKELVDIFWRARWLILGITLTFTLGAIIAARLSPKKYEAAVVLSPVTPSSGNQMGGLSSLTSQFGGLASLAGISVSGDSKKAEAVAVLQSVVLTEQYIRANNLLPVIYEGQWNREQNKWMESDQDKIPTLWKATQYLKSKVFSIDTDPKTGLVTLTVKWTDPEVAAQWANGLVKVTNEYLRNQAMEQTKRNIEYLNIQADKTDVVGVRQTIYAVLQNEINNAMVAQGNDEYAFKVLDPAVPPERPSSPRPLLWIIGGVFGGFALSFLIVLTRMLWSPTA